MSTIKGAFAESGFDGEQYACYDEFLDAEYQDDEYMRQLLSKEQYQECLADKGSARRGILVEKG